MATGGSKKPKGEPAHDLTSAKLVKSYVISLLISAPSLLAVVWLLRSKIDWPAAHLVFSTILLLSLGNFLSLILLDHFRTKTGSLTMPALLSTCLIILAILIVEGIDRFVPMLDFHWIYPMIALVMFFKYLALFREQNLALKFYLAVNIIALAALWNLGAEHKISLPF